MKKILSTLLVLMLIFTLTVPMTVSAADLTDAATPLGNAYLEKEFKKDENLATPNTSFTFTFTKKALNDELATDNTTVNVGSETVGSRVTAAMPNITSVVWNPTNTSATTPSGKGSVATVTDATTNGTKYFRIKLEDILPTFTHAGIYKYTVAETDGGVTNIDYSDMVYTLVIAVDTEGEIVVTVLNADETAKYDPTITNINTPTTQSEFVFTNILTKTSDLKIGKTVYDDGATNGNYGDKTKLFPFTTTLTTPSTQLVKSTTMVAHIYDASDADTGRTVEFTFNASGVGTVTKYQGATSTFYELSHGEYLYFWNDTVNTNDTRLPVGTTYTVGETLKAGQLYTPSAVTSVDNAGAGSDATIPTTGTAATAIAGGGIAVNTANIIVGEEANNSTIVTNTADYITPTGILMMILPFVIMIAIAAGGIFMLVFIKRRKATK